MDVPQPPTHGAADAVPTSPPTQPVPCAPSWVQVAPRTLVWWDGARFADDAVHHGRRTTMPSIRRQTTAQLWIWVGLGAAMWIVSVVLVTLSGFSAIVTAVPLALAGTAILIAMPLTATRLLGKLPPAAAGD